MQIVNIRKQTGFHGQINSSDRRWSAINKVSPKDTMTFERFAWGILDFAENLFK